MRFSARSKAGVLLSLVTILTLVGAFAVTIVSRGSATHASTSQGSQSTTLATHSISTTMGSSSLRSSSAAKNVAIRNMGARTLSGQTAQTTSGLHSTSASSSVRTDDENLQHNFNGISNLYNADLTPFIYEPPDQGLCVGYLTDTSTGQHIPMEYEMVNDVIAIYLPNGKLVIAQSLETFFGEKNFSPKGQLSVGDPRCYFDRLTNTFFFTATVIGSDTYLGPSSKSHIDLAAIDANTDVGVEILLDTTDSSNSHCPCYADYPTFGLDYHAVYVAYNEFPIASGGTFQYARLDVFSKDDLVDQEPVVHGSLFPPFPSSVFTLQPALNVGGAANSEYIENSFFGSSNTLALWHVTNDQNLATTAPKITLALIKVQGYTNPVLAASTGSGETSHGITSAAYLNPDDDRLQQVEGIQDEGQIELWSTLDTAINIPGDTKVRDGIAWFRINPESAGVVEQGIYASSGNYLIYPAIMHSNNGTTAIVFTITSKEINPSAAFTLSPSSPTNFGPITITAEGTGPYLTAFNRWGDYSAAALDLNGNGIWMGTEYVPPPATTTPILNWGTDIFKVSNGD